MACWRADLRIRHMPNAKPVVLLNGDSYASNVTPWSDLSCGPKGPVWDEVQALDFFGTRRTLDAFRRGMHCPPEERLPSVVARPYELNLSDLSCEVGELCEKWRVGPHRLSVTACVALQWRTALGSSVVPAMGLTLVSASVVMLLRLAARHLDVVSWGLVVAASGEVSVVAAPLQTSVSILLSFYVLNRVGWYWSLLMEGHALQGRCHDLAMIGGAKRAETDLDWCARYLLYRHVTLALFFAYQPHTPRLQFAGFGPLVACGLLEADEAEVLALAHRGPGTVVESWLASWVEANLAAELRQQAFHALRELRDAASVTEALAQQRAPVSFESLLFLAVYLLVLLLPLSLALGEDREAVMYGPHFAAVLGTGVMCAYYLALLHMLRHLQAPFDHIAAPNDALNPLALLNTTERKLRDYLTMPTAAEVGRIELPPAPEEPTASTPSGSPKR